MSPDCRIQNADLITASSHKSQISINYFISVRSEMSFCTWCRKKAAFYTLLQNKCSKILKDWSLNRGFPACPGILDFKGSFLLSTHEITKFIILSFGVECTSKSNIYSSRRFVDEHSWWGLRILENIGCVFKCWFYCRVNSFIGNVDLWFPHECNWNVDVVSSALLEPPFDVTYLLKWSHILLQMHQRIYYAEYSVAK